MTPRFVAVLAAFFIAVMALLKPAKLAELWARGYTKVAGVAPPEGHVELWVRYLPYVLIAGIVIFTAMDVRAFVRERRGNRKRITKVTGNIAIAELEKNKREAEATAALLEMHHDKEIRRHGH